jgi:SpoVK/Ycf46/Vps4 family AAA+-type ATPase
MNALKQLIEEQQQNSIVSHKMGPAKFLAPALVNNEHFEKALKQVSPSVKAEDRERYRRLREKFRHGNYHSEETTNAAAGQS